MNDLVVTYKIDDSEIKLTPKIVQEYILGESSGKITLPEFKMFCEIAKSRALNPFTKEIFLIKYGKNPAQIVVSKQAIMKRATMHPKFDGINSGIFILTSEGKIEKRNGGILLPSEQLIGSWAEVHRKDWKIPIFCSCTLSEIKNDSPLWRKMPCTMAIKTAVSRACRDAFPEDIGGLYDKDEISDESTALPELNVEDSYTDPPLSEELVNQKSNDILEKISNEHIDIQDI